VYVSLFWEVWREQKWSTSTKKKTGLVIVSLSHRMSVKEWGKIAPVQCIETPLQLTNTDYIAVEKIHPLTHPDLRDRKKNNCEKKRTQKISTKHVVETLSSCARKKKIEHTLCGNIARMISSLLGLYAKCPHEPKYCPDGLQSPWTM